MADRTVASAAADLRLTDTKIPSDIAAAKRKLLAELRKIEQEAKIRVGVSFDAAAANRDLARFRAQLKDVNIQLGVDAKAATADLQTFNAQIEEADRDDINVRVDVDNLTESTAQLQLFGALADEVDADDVNVRVDIDGAPQAIAAITAVRTATGDINRQERSGAGLAGAFAGIAGLIAPIGLVGAAIGAIGVGISAFGVKASADIEQTIAAFENLLGSAEAANELFGQIQDLADISPFETQTLAAATKSLLAIGVATEDVIPTVNTLAGAVSLLGGASAENFGRLTLALGQIRSSMKPLTVDLYQVQNALPGFNSKLQLAAGVAEQFGISNEEALAKIEDGAITGEQAYDILIQRMAEFPGAATAIAAQAETLQGKLSTFTDVVKRSLVESFLPITELIKEELPGITEATQDALDDIAPALGRSFESLIPRIVPLIETLGESLAPAFEGVFTALGSALEGITPVLEELGPIIGEIFPILGEIVAILGPAVADAAGALGGALVPALQAFADVLNEIPLPVLTGVIEAILALTVASKVAGGVTALGQSMGILSKSATIGFGPIGLAAVAITGLLTVLGNKAEAERQISERTDEVTVALQENTAALLENEGAMEGASTAAGAAALRYRVLGDALRETGEDGEKLTTALNNLGVTPTNENLIRVLGQIDAFGGPQGNVANVPEIMERLNAAFGNAAPSVAKLISENDHLDDTFDQLYNDGLRLTDSQEGLIRSIEELQDQSEKTDLAKLATETLQFQAAADPAFEAALTLAEGIEDVSRFTTDADDATRLFEATLREFEPAAEGAANIFGRFTDFAGLLPDKITAAQGAIEELAAASEAEFARAEEAIKNVTTVLDILLGRFDLDVAKQNLFESIRSLPEEFEDVVTVARQQAKDNGLDFSDFLVTGDTEAARIAFQDLVGPLVSEGINVVQQTLEQQGPDAAANIAGTLRLQIIDALTRAGIDQTEAAELAESYFPTAPWEAAARDAAVKAAEAATTEIEAEAGAAEIVFNATVAANTFEARAAVADLSNTPVVVNVDANTESALARIRTLQRILEGTLTPITGRFADGGIVEYYRQGGIKEHHVAQIAPAGAWRVWAEPETGGEAYIPLARQKRDRSEKILTTVADLFGMDVVPKPSAGAVARAAYGFGEGGGGGTAVLTREDVRTMARDIAEEVVAAMPAPVTVEHHPAGYSDPNAMAEIIYAKINRKVRRR